MAQPQWTKLNREQAHAVLQHLGTRPDAVVFSPDVTEVSSCTLPFYTNHWLYRLINYATMPTFSMVYISDGTEFIALNGLAHPIYAINEKSPIHLTEENVISYLEFFFSYVHGSEGDVFLIHDPLKMPFMNTLSASQKQAVLGSFKPFSVLTDAARNFKIRGTLYYGGGLIAATILMTPDGKMSFQEQSLLLSGINFPDSPYRQAWIDG